MRPSCANAPDTHARHPRTQGFKTEVFTKYSKSEAAKVYARCQTAFNVLPLCCIVDGKVSE